MAKRAKTRAQLLAEAQAVVEGVALAQEEAESGGIPSTSLADGATRPSASLHPSVKELERKLAYVQWLRSQNASRMRDAIEYTRSLEARDAAERFAALDRPERRLLIESHEAAQPLRVSSSIVDQFATARTHDREQGAKRRAALRREQRRQDKIIAERAELLERAERYRDKRRVLDAIYRDGTETLAVNQVQDLIRE